MLILPVALDQNQVRRTPWVTWVLMGICLVAQILLGLFGGGLEREADQRIEQCFRYLGAHPYLSPPPELSRLMGSEGRDVLERAAAEWAAKAGPVPPAVAAGEQEELNKLSREAFDAIARLPSSRLGFVPSRPNPVTLVTHTFVHAGWLHLIGNMLFLYLSGPFIEDLFGRPLFGLLYFLSGVAGAGAFAAGAPDSVAPLVGASGAISGVLGAFLFRLATRRIELLVLPIPIVPAFRFTLRFPAFVVIPLWAVEQLYYAKVAGAESTVAFSAHVGGFVAGLVFAFGMGVLRIEERFVNPAIEREISLEQNPALIRATDARAAGDLVTAQRLIEGVLKSEPGNVDAWTESWEIAIDEADADRASQAGLRLIELHGRGSDRDMVWSVVNDTRWRELPMTSRFLSVVADMLARAGDARGAIELHRRIAAQAPAGDVAGLRALVSEGELMMRAGDEKAARQAFERARGHAACTEPWLERIERALRLSRTSRAAGP